MQTKTRTGWHALVIAQGRQVGLQPYMYVEQDVQSLVNILWLT